MRVKITCRIEAVKITRANKFGLSADVSVEWLNRTMEDSTVHCDRDENRMVNLILYIA